MSLTTNEKFARELNRLAENDQRNQQVMESTNQTLFNCQNLLEEQAKEIAAFYQRLEAEEKLEEEPSVEIDLAWRIQRLEKLTTALEIEKEEKRSDWKDMLESFIAVRRDSLPLWRKNTGTIEKPSNI